MPDFVTSGERIDIPDNLMAFTHVVAQNIDEILVDHTAFRELHDWHENAFLINFICVRPETPSTHINHVSGTCKETGQFTLTKAWRHNRKVM